MATGTSLPWRHQSGQPVNKIEDPKLVADQAIAKSKTLEKTTASRFFGNLRPRLPLEQNDLP